MSGSLVRRIGLDLGEKMRHEDREVKGDEYRMSNKELKMMK